MLLNKLNCENSSEVATLKNRISNMETALHQYEKQEEKYHTELNNALAEFLIQKKMHGMFMSLNLQRNAYE